jgi:MoxR-like ATPase
MEAVQRLAGHVRREMGKVVVGQESLKTECLVVLLCQGHALLEGVPGIAKTLAIKTLSRLLRLEFHRVQCTSDLMPADIIGTNVVNLTDGAFHLHKGPAGDAGGASRVHGGAPGDDRWGSAPAVVVFHRLRDAESD